MKWKLVGAIPRDGLTIKVDGFEMTIRGAIGKAAVMALPRVFFELGVDNQTSILRRSIEVAQKASGLEDVLAVEEGVEFLRLVPVDLDERISEALGECESCCLDNEEDRKRVMETLRSKLTS